MATPPHNTDSVEDTDLYMGINTAILYDGLQISWNVQNAIVNLFGWPFCKVAMAMENSWIFKFSEIYGKAISNSRVKRETIHLFLMV